MKYKKQVLCGLMLCFCLCMTGCGKLYVMTDDEENQVVLYAAKMVSSTTVHRTQVTLMYRMSIRTSKRIPTWDNQTMHRWMRRNRRKNADDIVGCYWYIRDQFFIPGI